MATEVDTAEVAAEAKVAEAALLSLEGQIARDSRALAELQAELSKAHEAFARFAKSAADAGAKTDPKAVDALKKSVQQAQDSVNKKTESLGRLNARLDLTKSKMGKSKKGGDDLAEALEKTGVGANKIERALKDLGGPLGNAGAKMLDLGGAVEDLAAAGPAGVIAIIAVALAQLAAIAITATIAFGRFALQIAGARRNSINLLEGLLDDAAGAKILSAQIDEVARTTPIARQRIQALAEKLAKAGLRGKALADELRRLADEEAKAKFGTVDAGLLDFGVQLDKARENIEQLFAGINLEPFLRALQDVLQVFDSNTISGKALKFVITEIGNTLVNITAGALPFIKTILLEMIILGLQAYIAIKQFAKSAEFDTLVAGLKIVAIGFAFLLGIVAAIGALIALPFFLAAGAIVALSAGLTYIIGLFANLWGAISGGLASIDLASIGSNLMTSLASGIMGGAAGVVSAITGAVGGAIDAAKSMLGIASPSKVFAELGSQTAAGMSGGVDAGASDVRESVNSMVAPPKVKPAAGGGSQTFQAGGVQIIVQGASDPKQTALEVRKALVEFLESMSGQIGAGPSVEPV